MRFTKILQEVKKHKWGSPEWADYNQFPQNLHLWIQKKRDLTLKGFLKSLRKKFDAKIDDFNEINIKQYKMYGPEAYAAHKVVGFGGSYLSDGSSTWLTTKSLSTLVLNKKTSDFMIEGLDFSNTLIKYQGIELFENCLNIKTLKFHQCKYVDDWFVARIAGSFSDSLENLDISKNSLISDNGLLSLGKLKKLKYLNLSDLKQCKNIEYISFLLEQFIPNLEIEGVDYDSDQALENVQKRLELEEQEMKKQIESMDNENKSFVELLKGRQNEVKELTAK